MIPGIVSFPLFAAAQGMEAVASPATVNRTFGSGSGAPTTLDTPSVTVTVTGGTPPYSHSWTTDNPNVTPTAPSAATTAFEATVDPGDSESATCTDTITDANGVKTTAQCIATLHLVDFR
jgi:hypothetical protein